MSRREFQGRSAAEAAIKACEALGVSRSELKYDVVSDVGEGLARVVVISAAVPEGGTRPVERDEHSERPPRRDAPAARDSAPDGEGESDDARGASVSHEGRRPMGDDRGRGNRGGRDRDRGGDRGGRGGRGGRDRDRGGRGGRGRGGRDRGGPDRATNTPPQDDGLEALLNLEAFKSVEVPQRAAITENASPRAAKAQTVLTEVLRLMGTGIEVRLVQDQGDEIHFDLLGGDLERIIGKKGETLLSLQFLINRMVGREAENEQHVVLDAGGYRHRRRLALADLAKRLAERAVAERKVVRLSPMSAHDRRIFHITLQEMDGVTTRSQGEGLYRPLLIIPESEKPTAEQASEQA